MIFKKRPFKIGDSVRFKDGQKDEDSGTDMSGWQGRVAEINDQHKLLLVSLDSVTIKALSREYLEDCEDHGLGWSQYYIGFDDVEPAQPRDTESDVIAIIADRDESLTWAHLGEEGREINAILAGAYDEAAQAKRWATYLGSALTFPFKARVSEFQESASRLRVGTTVKVLGIAGIHSLYGVLVNVKRQYTTFTFPLCDLEAATENSPNSHPIYLYVVWYANR